MNKSEDIKDIAKALSDCQKTLRDVYKGTKGYGYNYAPLDKVYDEVRPKMTEHGLSLTHEKSFNSDSMTIHITSMLMHESGQWIEYNASLPFVTMKQMNDYQASGSGFTYLERYQTSAIFAITSDEDQDAQGEQEVKKYTAPSKATDAEKKQAWSEFQAHCSGRNIDAMAFLSADIDVTDKALIYKTIRQWLNSPDLLIQSLENFEG